MEFVPIIPISAKAQTNIERLMQKVLDIYDESNKKVSNNVLANMVKTLKPPPNGQMLNFQQIGQRPPVFKATLSTSVKESYIRYLRNALRDYFGFAGIPILIKTDVITKSRYR
jgi:predicted GTPase